MLTRYAGALVAGAVLLAGVSAVIVDVGGNCDRVLTDVNHDCVTNSADLGFVAQHFNEHVATYTPTITLTPTASSTPIPAGTPTAAANNPTPNDPQFSSEWNLQKIRAPLAWELSHGSASVKVAVLDTGIAPLPDLAANLGVGINTFNGGSTFDDAGSYGIGTREAGIIGAVTNNGRDLAGINWSVTIYPVKVCDASGYCPPSAVVAGIDWAIANGMRVIDTALHYTAGSFPAYTQADEDTVTPAVNRALAAGIIFVAAAGNNATGGVGYPGNLPGVIAVGATDSSDAVTSFSARGPQLALVAPGQSVNVYVSGGCCQLNTGTEISVAHVAGAVALMLAAGISDPVGKLERTAGDLGAPGRDDVYGYGRIDLYAAMVAP